MCCVLVVEDEPDVREMLDVLLSTSGYETMLACNGAEALAKLRARRPCLVLLDVMMPVMDGFEFRARQVSEPELAAVPVLCLTAMFDPPHVERRMGAPCLQKPVPLDELLAAIDTLCSKGRAPRQELAPSANNDIPR
jgi:CheY-like chemotaxis protein